MSDIIETLPAELIKDGTLPEEEVKAIVNKVVLTWNSMVIDVKNRTIKVCRVICNLLKEYPENSIMEIMKQVKKHPDLECFISPDRVWQGMRLITKRPELIQYQDMSDEEKGQIPDQDTPYLKKDGEIFWEFYFELAKTPLTEGVLAQIEYRGKLERWTFRRLREELKDAKDEMDNPDAFELRKEQKEKNIKSIIGICKNIPLEYTKEILRFCKQSQKKYISEIHGKKKSR